MSTIELSSGSATMTARADYLLVVEHGTLSNAAEALRYVAELELAGQRFGLRRLLVDARSETDENDAAGDARSAMWRWMRSQRAFDMIGYVLVDEMMIARVNMTALSERLPVRAFAAVAEGHRWLAKQRASSTTLGVAKPGPSSVPPPPMHSRTPQPAPHAPRTPLPTRGPTPTPPGPGRTTARVPSMSSQEADAILERTRQTQKIPAVDSKTAEAIVGPTPPGGAPRKPR